MISEIVCLTKTSSLDDMKEWLDWHINTCKFSLVHIIDNESVKGLKELCSQYKNVTYEYITGRPNQYKIYTAYVRTRMFKSNWIIFLDDDEYFWFNPEKFGSVEDVIRSCYENLPEAHMIAIRWKFLWPKDPNAHRTTTRLKHNTEEYTEDKMKEIGIFKESRMCKTLIKLDGWVYFQTAEENYEGGHIPIHSKVSSAVLISGIPVFNNKSLVKYRKPLNDDDLRILHCKVTSIEEFMAKNHFSIATKDDNMLKCTDDFILNYIKNKT